MGSKKEEQSSYDSEESAPQQQNTPQLGLILPKPQQKPEKIIAHKHSFLCEDQDDGYYSEEEHSGEFPSVKPLYTPGASPKRSTHEFTSKHAHYQMQKYKAAYQPMSKNQFQQGLVSYPRSTQQTLLTQGMATSTFPPISQQSQLAVDEEPGFWSRALGLFSFGCFDSKDRHQ